MYNFDHENATSTLCGSLGENVRERLTNLTKLIIEQCKHSL